MRAYYNEFEPYCVEWLRNLIAAGHLPAGDVDGRSISEVTPDDLRGYTQAHFFAGLGGWPLSLRLAGWPDDRPVWTGSCPCQPFSAAGKRKGFADDRHLWPVWRNLIAECAPATVLGEQVASAADWLRLVRGDLEALGYAVGAIPVEAASAGAYHKRDRFWFVAESVGADQRRHAGDARGEASSRSGEAWSAHGDASNRPRSPCGEGNDQSRPVAGLLAHALGSGRGQTGRDPAGDLQADGGQAGDRPCDGSEVEWAIGADGKARRVEPGIRLLAHGIPARVAKLRALGNAIDTRPAVAFIRAVMP